MVMDMFFSYVETEKKKRVHFHGFMLDVHKSERTSQCTLGPGLPLLADVGSLFSVFRL